MPDNKENKLSQIGYALALAEGEVIRGLDAAAVATRHLANQLWGVCIPFMGEEVTTDTLLVGISSKYPNLTTGVIDQFREHIDIASQGEFESVSFTVPVRSVLHDREFSLVYNADVRRSEEQFAVTRRRVH